LKSIFGEIEMLVKESGPRINGSEMRLVKKKFAQEFFLAKTNYFLCTAIEINFLNFILWNSNEW
jgi:hypothetical protein